MGILPIPQPSRGDDDGPNDGKYLDEGGGDQSGGEEEEEGEMAVVALERVSRRIHPRNEGILDLPAVQRFEAV